MPEQRSKISYLLERLPQGVAAHDRENPGHHTWGIGMSYFDIERLGLEEGEEILPGITIQVDGGVSGNFRILCDGQHEEDEDSEEESEREVVVAILAPPSPLVLPDPDSPLDVPEHN